LVVPSNRSTDHGYGNYFPILGGSNRKQVPPRYPVVTVMEFNEGARLAQRDGDK
jgi:hypothetical protein